MIHVTSISISPHSLYINRGDTVTLTAYNQDNIAVPVTWKDYPNGNVLATNSSTYTFSTTNSTPYGDYVFEVFHDGRDTSWAYASIEVQPHSISVIPQNEVVEVGDTITFTLLTDMGDSCDGRWLLNNQLDNIVIGPTCTITVTADMVGSNFYRVIYYGNKDLQTYAYFTVTDNGTEEPEPSSEPSPEPSPEPSGDWVTIPDMNASQSTQTNTILSAITEAVQEIKTAVQNDSRIYDLFTQSFVYHNFDFNTGKLSAQGITLNGFVPTFNHFAQNVEQYLGMLVDVRASEDEEEVKSETKGFLSILSDLFKADENTGKAEANTDDMNTIFDVGDDVKVYFSTGGNIGDIATIINSSDTWSWFGDEVAAEIDSVPSTYSRDCIENYYYKNYSEFYANVLGREWGDS